MPRNPTPKAIQQLLADAGATVDKRLPAEWQATVASRTSDGGVLRFAAPNGETTEVRAYVVKRLDPRSARALPDFEDFTVVVSSWISPRTQEVLAERGLSYADTTGNISLGLNGPKVSLAVRTQGARQDPSPRPRALSSLRGPRAWALERTLAEVVPPYSLGDLAEALGMDAGYISRLLTGLSEELLVERNARQPVEAVDWKAMIRQVAGSYRLLDDNETTTWVAPSGPEQFLRDLSDSNLKRWAATGSYASSRIVSVTAPEIAVVYTDDPERLAEAVRLRPTRTGGNVVLAVPYDPIVFRRTRQEDGLVFASLAQVAIDCLAGFGRMPAEGEALLDWMDARVSTWQAKSLTEDESAV